MSSSLVLLLLKYCSKLWYLHGYMCSSAFCIESDKADRGIYKKKVHFLDDKSCRDQSKPNHSVVWWTIDCVWTSLCLVQMWLLCFRMALFRICTQVWLGFSPTKMYKIYLQIHFVYCNLEYKLLENCCHVYCVHLYKKRFFWLLLCTWSNAIFDVNSE